MMSFYWTALVSRVMAIPTKIKLYAGIAIIIAIALWRWRAMGIRAAIEALERKDRERAQRIKEAVAVARSNHPDGDDDIIDRLHKRGQLRSD